MFWFSGGVQLTTMLVTRGRTWRELGTSGTRVSGKERRRARWDSDPPFFVTFHCPWGKVFRFLPNYMGLSFFFHYGQEFSKRICMYSEVWPQFNCSLRKPTQTTWNTRHYSITIIWKEKQRDPRAFPMEKNKLSFSCCHSSWSHSWSPHSTPWNETGTARWIEDCCQQVIKFHMTVMISVIYSSN